MSDGFTRNSLCRTIGVALLGGLQLTFGVYLLGVMLPILFKFIRGWIPLFLVYLALVFVSFITYHYILPPEISESPES